MDIHELKSKTLMLAMELLGKKLDVDPQVIMSWLSDRGAPPPRVMRKITVATENIDPFYFEVVDDPMASPGGKMLAESLQRVSEQLSVLQTWFTPVGVRFRKADGVCLINSHGEPASPWLTDIDALAVYLGLHREG